MNSVARRQTKSCDDLIDENCRSIRSYVHIHTHREKNEEGNQKYIVGHDRHTCTHQGREREVYIVGGAI
jgi:metallophosphoesterase superfamily enzyme